MLYADREAIIVRENGEYVQYLEIVDTAWEAVGDSTGNESTELRRMTLTSR